MLKQGNHSKLVYGWIIFYNKNNKIQETFSTHKFFAGRDNR